MILIDVVSIYTDCMSMKIGNWLQRNRKQNKLSNYTNKWYNYIYSNVEIPWFSPLTFSTWLYILIRCAPVHSKHALHTIASGVGQVGQNSRLEFWLTSIFPLKGNFEKKVWKWKCNFWIFLIFNKSIIEFFYFLINPLSLLYHMWYLLHKFLKWFKIIFKRGERGETSELRWTPRQSMGCTKEASSHDLGYNHDMWISSKHTHMGSLTCVVCNSWPQWQWAWCSLSFPSTNMRALNPLHRGGLIGHKRNVMTCCYN